MHTTSIEFAYQCSLAGPCAGNLFVVVGHRLLQHNLIGQINAVGLTSPPTATTNTNGGGGDGRCYQILWAFASVNVRATLVLRVVCVRLLEVVKCLNASNCSRTLWSLATLTYWAPSLLDSLAERMLCVSTWISAPNAAKSIWAMGTLGFRHPALVEVLVQRIINVTASGALQVKEIADMLDGLDRLEQWNTVAEHCDALLERYVCVGWFFFVYLFRSPFSTAFPRRTAAPSHWSPPRVMHAITVGASGCPSIVVSVSTPR